MHQQPENILLLTFYLMDSDSADSLFKLFMFFFIRLLTMTNLKCNISLKGIF